MNRIFKARIVRLMLMITWIIVDSSARGNQVGSDFFHLVPNPSGLDFITLRSSEALKPGIYHFSLMVGYAENSLPNLSTTASKAFSHEEFQNSTWASHLTFAVGLMENLHLGVGLTAIMDNEQKEEDSSLELTVTGLNDLRASLHYQVYGDQWSGLAMALTLGQSMASRDPYSGIGSQPRVTAEVVADYRALDVNMALNLGYQWRRPGEARESFFVEPFGDQLLMSAGVSRWWSSIDTLFSFEVFGARSVQRTEPAELSWHQSLEGIVGARYVFSERTSLELGTGRYLLEESNSPKMRIFLGGSRSFGTPSVPILLQEGARADTAATSGYSDESAPTNITTLLTLEGMRFDGGSVRMRSTAALKTLNRLVDRLKSMNSRIVRITVVAYLDSIGDLDKKKKTAYQRAEVVKQYLLGVAELGLKADNVDALAGVAPRADNATYQGRIRNQRIEVLVRSSPASLPPKQE